MNSPQEFFLNGVMKNGQLKSKKPAEIMEAPKNPMKDLSD